MRLKINYRTIHPQARVLAESIAEGPVDATPSSLTDLLGSATARPEYHVAKDRMGTVSNSAPLVDTQRTSGDEGHTSVATRSTCKTISIAPPSRHTTRKGGTCTLAVRTQI